MSNASQFFGGGGVRPSGLISGLSGLPFVNIAASGANLTALDGYLRNALTGGVTANVLKTVLSLSGQGAISFFALNCVDGSDRTNRVKITLDGAVIFDATSGIITSTSATGFVVGNQSTAAAPFGVNETPLLFNQSLLIEYASSLTETDKTRIAYRYYQR